MTRHTACSESSYWLAERAGCGAEASPASWRLAGPASGPARRLPVQSKQPTGSGPGGNGSRRTCCRVAAGSSLACPRCFLALPLLVLAGDSAGHGLALRPVSQCDLGRRDRGGEGEKPKSPTSPGAITVLTTWLSGRAITQRSSSAIRCIVLGRAWLGIRSRVLASAIAVVLGVSFYLAAGDDPT